MTTLLGHALRETQAVHDDHVMAQGGYLFYGRAVCVVIAESQKSGCFDKLIDAIMLSQHTRRSVAV